MATSLASVSPSAVIITEPSMMEMAAKATLIGGIIVFAVVFSFTFIMLFTFRPSFVCVTGDDGCVSQPRTADAGKCVVASLIIALVFLVIVWMFRASCKY